MQNKIIPLLIIWITSFWIIAAISPLNRHDWLMENILFLVFAAVLAFSYKKFRLSNISYILITAFATLHLTGAHYTYSEVPFGFYLSEVFHFSRNHFDRIVHFSFGLLLVYPVRELLIRFANIRGFFSYYLPIDVVLACSGLFEIIEWLFVMMVNPELGDAYLGTQGDIWDAQKDMVLATIGALIATILILISSFIIPKSKKLLS